MAKTCFVVGPIGAEGSETRKRSDALLEYIIKEVLEDPPFKLVVDRADEIQKPGLITQQVIERVVNADLVVADLTDQNPNAFYELALRHALRKPVVHLVLSGQTVPFDIAHQRIIYYDTHDLGAAERAKEELRNHAEAALKGTDAGDNPISAALVVMDLAQSRNSTDQSLARVLKEVSELKEDVRVIARTLTPPRVAPLGIGIPPTGTGPGLLAEALDKFRSDGAAASERIPKFTLDTPALKAIAEALRTTPLKPSAEVPGGKADAPLCAICKQPIGGPVGRRSADNAPIHWEGKCPTPPITPSAVASG